MILFLFSGPAPRVPTSESRLRLALLLLFSLSPPLPAQLDAAEQPAQDTAVFVEQLVKDSQRHVRPRTLPESHPLRQAEIACAAMAGDVAELGLWQRRVMAAYAAAGHWEEAEILLSNIIGYNAVLARAEYAILALKAERRSDEHQKVLTETSKGADAFMDLKREQVLVLCARLAAALKDQATLEVLLPRLGAHDRLDQETALIQEGSAPPPSKTQAAARIDELKPGNAAACRYLLAAARQQFAAKSEEASALLEMVGDKAGEPRVLDAARQLLDIARLARAQDLPAVQDKAAALFERMTNAYEDSSEWKPSCFVLLASFYLETGNKVRAKELIARAEEAARRVTIIYAPSAWVEIAAVYRKLDDAEAELRCVLQSLEVATALNHQRARGPGDILICLHYAETKRELPDEILPLIEKLRHTP